MRNILYILFINLCVVTLTAQTYNMPASGSVNTCSGTFYDSGGSGGSYANSENRTYTICSSTAGQMVSVNFSAFNLESGFDNLEIFDGNSTGATLIGTYTGTTSPGVITATSASGCLTFRFTSDGSVTATGWAASVSCVAPGGGGAGACAGTINMPASGNCTSCSASFFDSGGSGGSYGNSENRTYTVCPGTAGQMVSVNFSAFNLESGFDNLEIFDGNSTGATLIGTYTGTTSPGTITATNANGCLTFRFTSDGSVTATGWAATLSCQPPGGGGGGACAGSINMPTSGNCTSCNALFYDSGGSGGTYSGSENRVYTICPATAGSRVTVNFTTFNLENSFDFLEVFDGNSTAAPSLGVYTGTTGPGLASATVGNATGCLTFRFTSDGSVNNAGWAATVGCSVACQSITANFTSSSPAVGAGSTIRLCQGQSLNLVGSGTFSTTGVGATYTWSMGNGQTRTGTNVNYTYPTPGSYLVNLTVQDPNGCTNNNFFNQVVQVSTTPTFTTTATPASVCIGQPSSIQAGVTPTPYITNCTPPVSGTTFLPDGSGVSYTTSIPVNCYAPGQTITAATDIQNVCLTMEHSYLGDLNIRIICPNGQSTVLKAYPGSAGTYLGAAIDDVISGPGTGALYCFTPTATTLLINGGTVLAGTPASASIVPGNYMPQEPFSNLIGCPANGNWTIEVTDNLASDDGYIFDWDINLTGALQGAGSFTPTIASQGWVPTTGLVNVNATTANVTPAVTGSTCYNYSITDNFGCTYTTNECVTAVALPTAGLAGTNTICAGQSTTLTASGGGTYAWSGGLGAGPSKTVSPASTTTYTVTVTNASGCTATATETVTVNSNSTAPTGISGTNAVCSGNSTTLTVTGGALGLGAGYNWYTGSCGGTLVGTGNSITVSPVTTTTYYVRAEGSCNTTACASIVVTVSTTSTAPTITPIAGTFCPNTNVTLTAGGGVAGAGSNIYWYAGPNGTGGLLGTGVSLTYTTTTGTVTMYARREGACNTTTDDMVTINVKSYIYAANGTSTNTYCTDNAGWHHFYVGDDIIFSTRGDLSSAPAGFPEVTIWDNNAFYQNSVGPFSPTLCATGWTPGEEQFEMERSWNLDMGGGAVSGGYEIRFYYEPAERAAIENAAIAWMATYPACGYTYKYASQFYWFKNTGSNYTAPDYDGTHYTAIGGTTFNGVNYSEWTGIPGFSGGSGAVILVPDVLLPVDWEFFTGETDGNVNYLRWATAFEHDTRHFEIERSPDGLNYEVIGVVAAQGNSSTQSNYAFNDITPFEGLNYYRLRLLDNDGVENMSNVVVLEIGKDPTGYVFYPNPTSDVITYQYNGAIEENLQIEIIDVLGRVLKTTNVNGSIGLNQLTISLEAYPIGSYMVRVKHLESAATHIEKIVKNKE